MIARTASACPCGSGLASEWQRDARGIEMCRTCPKCHAEKMRRYRPEVLTDPHYAADEPIEPENTLTIWTVYEHPRDYPTKFVARATFIGARPGISKRVLLADTLAELRAMLPPGLVMMPRMPEDDPVIVETWM